MGYGNGLVDNREFGNRFSVRAGFAHFVNADGNKIDVRSGRKRTRARIARALLVVPLEPNAGRIDLRRIPRRIELRILESQILAEEILRKVDRRFKWNDQAGLAVRKTELRNKRLAVANEFRIVSDIVAPIFRQFLLPGIIAQFIRQNPEQTMTEREPACVRLRIVDAELRLRRSPIRIELRERARQSRIADAAVNRIAVAVDFAQRTGADNLAQQFFAGRTGSKRRPRLVGIRLRRQKGINLGNPEGAFVLRQRFIAQFPEEGIVVAHLGNVVDRLLTDQFARFHDASALLDNLRNLFLRGLQGRQGRRDRPEGRIDVLHRRNEFFPAADPSDDIRIRLARRRHFAVEQRDVFLAIGDVALKAAFYNLGSQIGNQQGNDSHGFHGIGSESRCQADVALYFSLRASSQTDIKLP